MSKKAVETRRVSFGIFLCVKITSLKKDAYMATKPSKKSKKGGAKDQLRFGRSLYNWVVYLKILIRENLFYVNLENWGRNTPSNSPKALGTNSKFGKGGVHREELSKRVRLMSVVLARQNST